MSKIFEKFFADPSMATILVKNNKAHSKLFINDVFMEILVKNIETN